jgi:hypothetical protein
MGVGPKEPGFLRNLGTELARSAREHVGPTLIVLTFAVAGWIVGPRFGLSVFDAIWNYIPTYINILPVTIALILAARGAGILLVDRPKRPLSMLWSEIRDRFVTSERIAFALPALVFIPIFAGTFSLSKLLISKINPFVWDVTFAHWDRVLHFGYAPWELLQPVLGRPLITWTVNWFYNAWFGVMAFVWIWQAFSMRDKLLRLQFFYALLLAWILLGSVAATIFSSAGPCFYGLVIDGQDPFAPLLAYLQDANRHEEVWALKTQAELWQTHTSGELRLGGGVSAMPSLHVTMAFLIFLVCWRTSKIYGALAFGFFLLILIGSVHLAWHYAIDGYFAVPATLLIWWLSGRLAALTYPTTTRVVPAPA